MSKLAQTEVQARNANLYAQDILDIVAEIATNSADGYAHVSNDTIIRIAGAARMVQTNAGYSNAAEPIPYTLKRVAAPAADEGLNEMLETVVCLTECLEEWVMELAPSDGVPNAYAHLIHELQRKANAARVENDERGGDTNLELLLQDLAYSSAVLSEWAQPKRSCLPDHWSHFMHLLAEKANQAMEAFEERITKSEAAE